MPKSRWPLVAAIYTSFVLMFISLQPARAYLVPPGEYPIHGTYRGVLPCADCVGVWTEVILVDLGTNPFEPGQGSGTFTMRQRFTGGSHGGATITTHGKWSTIQPDGFGAGTLELRAEERGGKPLAPEHFYCDHGRSLKFLSSKSNQPIFDRPDTLERVIPPARPQFVVTERNNNVPIIGRVGDTFQVDLPTTLADVLDTWVMKQAISKSIALEGQSGSSVNDNAIITFFMRAVAPGTTRIEFQRVKGSPMTVTFPFQITR